MTDTITSHRLYREAICLLNTKRHDVQIDRYGMCSSCDLSCICGSGVSWLGFTDPECHESGLLIGPDMVFFTNSYSESGLPSMEGGS